MPPDPDDCEPHHIVPLLEGRSWAREYVETSRKILKECGIDIDSAENGVFLPANREGSGCEGSYHRTIHNSSYYRDLSFELTAASNQGCDEVLKALSRIKLDIVNSVY